MISKNEIKEVRALSQKKFRDESGLFVAEGEKLVAEALASGFEVVKVFRSSEIGEEAMSRISSLSSPSPVLAVIRQKRQAEALCEGPVLALDSLRDPGNVGTIIRLADWFGIRSIIASEDTVDIYNPKVVQATMGAIFRVSWRYCCLPDEIRSAGRPVIGTFLNGADIYSAELPADAIIVMGSESNGISPEVEALVTSRVTIPSFCGGRPTSESLNVAVATAITCSEIRRRGL